jgi:hypothetical protein
MSRSQFVAFLTALYNHKFSNPKFEGDISELKVLDVLKRTL